MNHKISYELKKKSRLYPLSGKYMFWKIMVQALFLNNLDIVWSILDICNLDTHINGLHRSVLVKKINFDKWLQISDLRPLKSAMVSRTWLMHPTRIVHLNPTMGFTASPGFQLHWQSIAMWSRLSSKIIIQKNPCNGK